MTAARAAPHLPSCNALAAMTAVRAAPHLPPRRAPPHYTPSCLVTPLSLRVLTMAATGRAAPREKVTIDALLGSVMEGVRCVLACECVYVRAEVRGGCDVADHAFLISMIGKGRHLRETLLSLSCCLPAWLEAEQVQEILNRSFVQFGCSSFHLVTLPPSPPTPSSSLVSSMLS